MDITDSCLDAETLAAWVDGGLTAPELARAQAHVADCARCQALVGTLVRINAAAPAAKPDAAWRGWLGWLVPLTAAAAAVTIWVVIPGSNLDSRVPVPTVTLPQASAPIAEPSPSEAKAKDQAASTVAAPTTTTKNEAAPASQSTARAMTQAPSLRPAPEATSLMDAKKERSEVAAPVDAVGSIGGVVGGIPPGVSVPAQPPAAPPAPMAAPVPAQPRAGGGGGGGAPSAVAMTGDAPAARAQTGASANVMESVRGAVRRDFASPAEIVSPDPMMRWRIAGTNVERSFDGGAVWEMTQTGVTTPLTAGAAPSLTVVWIVGRSGVVLLSTDGRTWRRVTSPAITDLSSVRARDARTASVTATDGRVFSTTDAGTTWIPGPLQGF